MLFLLPVVCRLLRRCWLPSRKNFAALKQFGVCDNKHFDFDFDIYEETLPSSGHGVHLSHISLEHPSISRLPSSGYPAVDSQCFVVRCTLADQKA